MREICDKHFPDNWVIPVYGGQLIDLLSYWDSFPAAKKALLNNIHQGSVQALCHERVSDLKTSSKSLNRYIIDGQLNEKEALSSVKDLLACLRDANSTIKWVILHQHGRNANMLEIVNKIVKEDSLIRLMLKLSKFELLLKELISQIVKKKSTMWTKD
jgi:WASH complex subunit strumpellin